jgi:hypothetical protein
VEQYLLELQRRIATTLGLPERCHEVERGDAGNAAKYLLGSSVASLSPEDYQRHAAMLALWQEEIRFGPQARPFERLDQTSIWSGVRDRVAAAMRARGLSLRPAPPVGTLPTHAFEPMVVLAPGGGAVVGIDANTSVFLNLLGKAVAQFFLQGGAADADALDFSPRDWAVVLTDEHPAVRAYADMILGTLAGRSAWARPYLPNAVYEAFASELRDLMEVFLLGRAFAHVASGHVERASRAAFELPGAEVETPAFSLEDEIRADLLAFDLVVADVRVAERPVAVALVAVESLLATLSILDSARALLVGTAPACVVPPSAGRHELRQRAVRYVAGVHDDEDGCAVDFARSLRPSFDILWEKVERALYTPDVAANVRRPGLYDCAWSQLGMGQSQRVERLVKLAAHRHGTAVKPESPAVWRRLGAALVEAGECDEATECHRRAADLATAAPEAKLAPAGT